MEATKSGSRVKLKLWELLSKWQKSHPESLPYKDESFHQEVENASYSASTIVIQVFMGIGAWIAGLLFLELLDELNILNSENSRLIFGAACVSFYLLTSYFGRLKPAFESSLLTVGLIGQVYLAWAIGDIFTEELHIYIIGILIEAAILLLTFSSIQRFTSTILIFMSFLGLIHEFEIYEATHVLIGGLSFILAYFWIKEPKVIAQDKRFSSFMNPVGLGIATSIILLLMLTVNKEWHQEFIEYWWISGIFMIGSVLYVLRSMIEAYEIKKYKWLVYAAAIVMLGPTVFSPGIAAAIFILLLGFYRGHYILSGLGTLAMTVFTFMFYYNLQITLLQKSMLLMGVGLVFMVLRIGFILIYKKETKLNQFEQTINE